MTAGHPVADLRNTVAETSHRVGVVGSRHTNVDLRVVGIRVCCKPTSCNDVEEFGRVQNEKNGAQHRPLRDTKQKQKLCRQASSVENLLHTTAQKRRNPVKSWPADAKLET